MNALTKLHLEGKTKKGVSFTLNIENFEAFR